MRSGTAIFHVGLFGNDYGSENAGMVSPTGREFDLATAEGKCRLIYVRGRDNAARHPQMRAVVEYLEERQLIRSGPFDAVPCTKATLEHLDPERMAWFLRTARATRRFPIAPDASSHDLLEHLNLLDDGVFPRRQEDVAPVDTDDHSFV
jgi:hypothetical protein